QRIVDDLYYLLLHPFLQPGIADLPDCLFKVRVVSNGYHESISSMKSPAFFLLKLPFEYSSNAFSVFSANRISSRNAGSMSVSGLRMIRSPSRMIRIFSPSGRSARIEAGMTT